MIKVGESRSIDVHWRGDDDPHDPGGDNHDDCGPPLPLGHVLDGIEDGVEPVKADTDEAVDAGRAEGDVTGDPELACNYPSLPASVLHNGYQFIANIFW